jgi:hypothetical protein
LKRIFSSKKSSLLASIFTLRLRGRFWISLINFSGFPIFSKGHHRNPFSKKLRLIGPNVVSKLKVFFDKSKSHCINSLNFSWSISSKSGTLFLIVSSIFSFTRMFVISCCSCVESLVKSNLVSTNFVKGCQSHVFFVSNQAMYPFRLSVFSSCKSFFL